MHEAADAPPEMVRKSPDMARAMFAMDAALEIFDAAREKFNYGRYGEAFQESKGAIRMASSALLLRDGYVASTFEATAKYIADKYDDLLPVDEWWHIESMPNGDGPGILNLIIRLAGKNKETGEGKAGRALEIAERFLELVRALIELEL